MNRSVIVLALLVNSASAYPTEGIAMWGCAAEGGRRNVLYLADRGSRSYVKFGTQRVTAAVTLTDSKRIWSFGNTSVELNENGVAEYIEHGTLKSRFKCKLMQ